MIIGLGSFPPALACHGNAEVSCSNTILAEVASPGAELKAVVFTRDCGATTGFSTQVSVLPAAAKLPVADGGNLFVADTDHGRASPGIGGGPKVQVEWVGRNRLRVIHDPRARVFKAVEKVAAARVEYVPPVPDGA